MPGPRLLIFGASGAIGQAIVHRALAADWIVVGATRNRAPSGLAASEWLQYDPIDDPLGNALADVAPFDGVCWAQGANINDSPRTLDVDRHLDLYRANCVAVLASLAALVTRDLLSAGGARLVVVSSIWQERARQNKLSYTVTKAAIGGLVRSASVDLGSDGHLINAVLPGVLDTPMTASNLTPRQIDAVRAKTSLARLPDLATLADTVLFLCSAANRSITGQSIAVDTGMSVASLV